MVETLERDVPGAHSGIGAGGNNASRAAPGEFSDSSHGVGRADKDALCGVGQTPHDDVGVERAGGKVLRGRGPRDAGQLGRVVPPRVVLQAVAGSNIKDKEVAVAITHGQVSTVRRVGDRLDAARGIKHLAWGEGVAGDVVDVDLALLAAHGQLGPALVDGDARALEGDGQRKDLVPAAQQHNLVDAGHGGEIALHGRVARRAIELDGRTQGRRGGRGEADGVVHARGDELAVVQQGGDDSGGVGGAVGLAVAVAKVDGGHAPVVAGAIHLLRALVDRKGGEGLVVALDNAARAGGVGGIKIGDEAIDTNREKVRALPQAADLLVLDIRAHGKGADTRVGSHVPQLNSAVTRRRDELLAIGAPGDSVHSAIVGVGRAAVELGDLLSILAIIHKELPVGTTRHVQTAVRGKAHRLAEARVVAVAVAELEGRAGVEGAVIVLAGRGDTEGTVLAVVDRVDGLSVAGDLAHRRARVPHDGRGKHLLALAAHHNAPIVWRPRQVADGARERAVLVLEDVLLLRGIPNAQLARDIGRGDVEAARGVLGHSGRG
eukprot:m.223675 g.223675  ORF g.223675 m.223675 type:complete len:548 (-) comp16296_c0_seq1:220-1863(-)